MARVVGIDPGSISFDLCGWEQGRVFLDQSVPSDQVADRAESILEMITASGPVDLILGPSGYGLPVTDVQDIGERELFLMTLVEAQERQDIPVLAGMEALINLARVRRLPLCFTPAVVHLPTVPRWRKINKIDLGTADKLNCAILAIYDQAHTYQIHYQDTALILVEVGGAFTSVIAVDQGQVVDGIGGSAGAAGFKSGGALDGELAYLLKSVQKRNLFEGGITDIVGEPQLTLTEYALRLKEEELEQAWLVLEEAVVKAVAGELALVPTAKEIVLSGRLCRQPLLNERLVRRLSCLATVRTVNPLARIAKEAAQGAALLAAGLVGGETAPLVEQLRIREASGTVFDHIVPWGDDLRRRYRV